jgi:hypothetical protein
MFSVICFSPVETLMTSRVAAAVAAAVAMITGSLPVCGSSDTGKK